MKGLYLFQRYLPFTELILFVLFCASDVVLSSRAQFFFSQGTWERFRRKLCVGRYCPLTEVREIGPPYYETKQMELILCQVLVIIGISASESKFSPQSLF